MKKFLLDNSVIIVIGIFFLITTTFAVRNYGIIQLNHALQIQSDLVKQRTQEILSRTMHGLDLGVRGFGLTRDEKLLIPYKEAIQTNAVTFYQLDSLLKLQAYHDRATIDNVRAEVQRYIAFCNKMIQAVREGDTVSFTGMLKEDRGYSVWSTYTSFAQPLFEYETTLKKQSLEKYQSAMELNLFLQIGCFLLGMPVLFIFVSQVKKERKLRADVLKEVEHADTHFVFNPGPERKSSTVDINKRSIENIKFAGEFIKHIASGNYDVEWHTTEPAVLKLNQTTLAGNLLNLRDRLRSIKTEDERRNWINEGIGKFADLVRTNQEKEEELTVKSVSFLTKYLKAQQGSLFLLEEGEEPVLKLAACYAFDKRKFIDKTIPIGHGIIGQAFLEAEPVLLRQVPKEYIHITSGLGDATPTTLVVIPMKSENKVVALIELATFFEIKDFQIEFLVKAGEYFAAAVVTTHTATTMKQLVDDSLQKEIQMKQREEELLQNMEELQATQEELHRRQLHQQDTNLSIL